MSTEKHTPGVWEASDIRTHGANPRMNGCDVGSSNGANIAIVLHEPGDRWAKETIANARLIAAAPDLLAALQLVRMSNGWRYLADESKAVIDSAIARATLG